MPKALSSESRNLIENLIDRFPKETAAQIEHRAKEQGISVSDRTIRRMKSGEPYRVHNLPEKVEPVAIAQDRRINRLAGDLRIARAKAGDWDLFTAAMAGLAPELPIPKPRKSRAKPTKCVQEVVACLNDYHGNAAWGFDKTDGKTEWNFELFCRTLNFHVQSIIGFALEDRAKYGLKKLHLDMLGDMWHGRLRVEDQVTNNFPTAPGMMMTAWVLFQAILQLAEHFEAIDIRCMAGNHGRIDKKPEAQRYVEESFETIIHLMLKALIATHGLQERVRVIIPNTEVHTFIRLGHKIKIGHGGHIKGGNNIAGIPIYGLSREILRQFRNEVASGQEQGISLIVYGHFHDYHVLKNTMLISGAGCPTGPWALHRFGEFADPTNLIYYTSKQWAIGWSLPISLKHGHDLKHPYSYESDMFLNSEFKEMARC